MCPQILECRDVTKTFGKTAAVRGLNLTLDQGLIYALLGPSGCGKSTTLRLVAGLAMPDKGTITLRGRVVNDPESRVPPDRRRIGMVFQTLALWPHMTVEKNLTFVVPEMGRAEGKKEASRRLDAFGLIHRLKAYPHELSEGERQRVAIARALMKKPDLLLLDEPFANLDRPLKRVILDEIAAIRKQEGVTVLLVSHDAEEALSIADWLFVMQHGAVAQEGRPEDVYSNPAHPFIMYILGHGGVMPGQVQEGRIVSPLGSFMLENADGEGEVLLAFRPKDISLVPEGQGTPGVVMGGHYEGERWHWRVEVANHILSLWGPGPPPMGEVVWLKAFNRPTIFTQKGVKEEPVL